MSLQYFAQRFGVDNKAFAENNKTFLEIFLDVTIDFLTKRVIFLVAHR
jgi:hypothetical protein